MSIEVRAEKMAAGGDAIARMADGRVAFVRGALPNELVAIEVVQSKKDFVRAEVVDVIEPAAYRVVPPCPAHTAGCGGCTWQHVDAAAQLELKTAVVIEALKRTGRIIDPVVAVGTSVPPWAYRTTLRLATGIDRLGLRGRHSHDVVELGGCPVSHPLLEELLAAIRVRGQGEVSLRVGAATGERSAWVVDGDVELLDVPSDVEIGPAAVVHEVIGGVRLQVSAASFFQSGPAAAELLLAAVRRGERRVVRCQHRHRRVRRHRAVRLGRRRCPCERCRRLRRSVRGCGGQPCRSPRQSGALDGRAVEAAPRRSRDRRSIAQRSRPAGSVGVVPRQKPLESCWSVVIRCHSLAMLVCSATQGYEHTQSTVFDLFPQTHHVEVVTTFDRQAP